MLDDIDVSVEVAFTSGYSTAAADRAWTDVSAYVEGDEAVSISYGRGDQFATIDANQCSLTLDNSDGRFTPGNAAGAYYPNVRLGRPLRVRVRTPQSQAGNILAAEQSTFEPAGSAASWTNQPGLFGACSSVARSTTRAWQGSASLLVTWNTSAAGATAAGTLVSGLVIGKTYTLSGYVWVPAGNPAVRLSFDLYAGASSAQSTTTGAWERLSVTWTATISSLYLVVINHAASTAGQTVYVDGLMIDDADSLRSFTTTAPPYIDRFLGYVQEWPASFPGATAGSAVSVVTATSRRARLALGNEARSVIEQELALDEPLFHYTLGEPAEATSAGNSATTSQPPVTVTQRGSGGTIVFGEATGPGTDSLTAATFTRVSSGNGKYLASPDLYTSSYTIFDENLVLEAWFSTTGAAVQTIAEVYNNGGQRLALYVNASGKLAAELYLPGATVTTATATGTTTVSDGATRHARAEITKDGTGTVSLKVHVDNTVEATVTSFAVGEYAGVLLLPDFNRVVIGGRSSTSANPGDLFGGTIAHVACFSSPASLGAARFQAHYDAGATGFASETAAERVERYATWAGIPAAELDLTGPTAVAAVDSTGRTVADLMELVTGTEGGLLYDGRDGRLVLQPRSARHNPTTALTLDVTAQTVGSSLIPIMDYADVINDASVSGGTGVIYRALNAASAEDHGARRTQRDTLATTDAEVESLANSLVNRYGEPRTRIPSVEVDVLNSPATVDTIAALDLSDVIELTNCPAQVGASTVGLFIEGYSETLAATSWVIAFNTTSTDGSAAWILGDSVLSVLGSTTIPTY